MPVCSAHAGTNCRVYNVGRVFRHRPIGYAPCRGQSIIGVPSICTMHLSLPGTHRRCNSRSSRYHVAVSATRIGLPSGEVAREDTLRTRPLDRLASLPLTMSFEKKRGESSVKIIIESRNSDWVINITWNYVCSKLNDVEFEIQLLTWFV